MNSSSTRKSPLVLGLAWALAFAFLLTSCDTIKYGPVQTKFEECVEADNLNSVSGGSAGGGDAKSCYNEVISSLQGLDSKNLEEGDQKGNAYLLLGMSQWRTGKYREALTSSEKGLKQKGLTPGSRDTVLLTLLPALAVDSEIHGTWLAAGKSLTPDAYTPVENDYKTVFATVTRAENAITSETTQGTSDFVNFQKARLVNNWRSVINSIGSTVEERTGPRERANAVFGGKKLRDVMEEARGKISSDSGFQNLFTK